MTTRACLFLAKLATGSAAACIALTSCGGGGGDTQVPPVSTPAPAPAPSPPPPAATTGSCSDPTSRSVALVVDREFALPARNEIDRLASDIARDLTICVRTMLIDAATSAAQIRSQLKVWYGANGLQGAILIGDVPTVRMGDYTLDGVIYPAFITDTFFEVMNDAFWKDPDGNGIYNRTEDLDGTGEPTLLYDGFTADRERNIWTGRLTPPRGMVLAERVNRLRAYLDRNHQYRIGQRSYQPRMLYFNSVGHNGDSTDTELDQATNRSHAEDFYNRLGLFALPVSTGLSVMWDNDLVAQTAQWRTSMQEPVEYAFITVHGAPDFQQFSPTNIPVLTSSDYQVTPPKVFLLDIDSCNNGAFETSNYLAGHALFTGDVLAVRAFTDAVLLVTPGSATFNRRLLATGMTLGEVHKNSDLPEIAVLLGDPTLKLRPQVIGPSLTINQTQLVFPDAPAASPVPLAIRRTFTITNTGMRTITIDRNENGALTSWNSRGRLNRSIINPFGFRQGIDPTFLLDPADVVRFPLTLAPGASDQLGIYFSMDFANPKPGMYRWRATFSTDSGSMPTFTVYTSQRLF